MVGRIRQRDLGGMNSSGTARTRYGYTSQPGKYLDDTTRVQGVDSTPVGHEQCVDSTSPYPFTQQNTLYIGRRYLRAPVLNGTVRWQTLGGLISWETIYTNWRSEASSNYTRLPNPGADSIPAIAVTEALSNLNPNKALVNLPLFLFELKDFPSMLRQYGRMRQKKLRPTDAGGAYVAWSFGWAPIISDLTKLVAFGKALDNRISHLKRMDEGSRFRRQLKSAKWTTSDLVGANESYSATLGHSFDIETQHSVRRWFTCEGELRSELPVDADALRWDAIRRLLGLRMSPSTLWDALPWSWLIDYFLNVGSFLEATNGVISHSFKNMCIMQETTHQRRYTNIQTNGDATYSFGPMKSSSKLRAVHAFPVPRLGLESFLTGHQMGILGSLALVKALRTGGYR